jgi:hypothetical protein
MAAYSANRPNKTLVIHKPDCRVIPYTKLSHCGCGETGEQGNQRWFCEEHITRNSVDEFMHDRFWAILICDLCFQAEQEVKILSRVDPIKPLEDQFYQAMQEVAEFANQHNFGIRFRQMIKELGAIGAAKRLLSTREIQAGLMRLWELKALNKSMEALVIQERFRPLFTDAEIAEARRRLDELGYHETF